MVEPTLQEKCGHTFRKKFLLALNKHLNPNTEKLSYSGMPNVSKILARHNKKGQKKQQSSLIIDAVKVNKQIYYT